MQSEQWADLPPSAVKLLFELALQYKGDNNGDLSAPFSVLRARGWSSEPTLWKHLKTLEDRGWIIKTKQGGRHIGCNLYAVSWWPIDHCGGKHQNPASHKPSNLWKNFGTAKNEVQDPQKVKSKAVALQKLKGKPIRFSPAL